MFHPERILVTGGCGFMGSGSACRVAREYPGVCFHHAFTDEAFGDLSLGSSGRFVEDPLHLWAPQGAPMSFVEGSRNEWDCCWLNVSLSR